MPSLDRRELDQLLLVERGRLRSVEPFQPYYDRITRVLAERLTAFGVSHLPETVVVSSPFALTEVLRRGRTAYVIYDQFLGQILSRLTALVDQAAPLSSIDCYLSKLYAARLLFAGRGREALMVALVHHTLRAEDDFRGLPSPERLRSVLEQETYAMAHELAHVAFAESDELRSRWFDFYFGICSVAEEIRAEMDPVIEDRVYAEMLADDHNREWVRRHGPMDEEVLTERRTRMVENFLTKSSFRPMTVDEVRGDPVLAEEAACDGLSAVLTVQATTQGDPDAILQALCSSLRASQHLRLIKVIDSRIRDPRRVDASVHATTARGAQLRLFLRAVVESETGGLLLGLPEETENLDFLNQLLVSLRDVNVLFYEQLFDSILTGSFYERFESPAAVEAMTGAVADLPAGPQSWGIAADLLDFART